MRSNKLTSIHSSGGGGVSCNLAQEYNSFFAILGQMYRILFYDQQ